MIGNHMATLGTAFVHEATPQKLERQEDGKILVTYMEKGIEKTDVYDTVLFAIGRYAVTHGLNLANAGVVAESNGKLRVNEQE